MRYNSANLDELILSVIYGYYIRYDNLRLIINCNFPNSNADEVFIYIDLRNILMSVGRYISDNQLNINNPLVLTSGIINMVAHYRQFFMSRYNCKTTIFIIDSADNVVADKYIKGFQKSKLNGNIAKLYDMNKPFLENLCKYIYNVQYEYTNYDFATKAIALNKIENKKEYPAFLITKDVFSYQAASIKDIYVLRPKKKDGDSSIFISFVNNLYEYYRSVSSSPMRPLVPSKRLSMLMALSRVPTRAIPSLFTLPNAFNIVSNTDKDFGIDPIWDIDKYLDTMIQCIDNRGKVRPDMFVEIKNRYMACDAISQVVAYNLSTEAKLYNGIVNLYDPNSVKHINNEYFQSCPLDLNVL